MKAKGNRTAFKIKFEPSSFGWHGVEPKEYHLGSQQQAGMRWRGVARYSFATPPELPAQFALRYFELEPGGYSRLEKHAHIHLIFVLRGHGKALVGERLFDLQPFDLLYVPPWTPHRWINEGEEPFGFLCPVDAERDRPQPLSAEEWEALKRNPTTAPYVF